MIPPMIDYFAADRATLSPLDEIFAAIDAEIFADAEELRRHWYNFMPRFCCFAAASSMLMPPLIRQIC